MFTTSQKGLQRPVLPTGAKELSKHSDVQSGEAPQAGFRVLGFRV